MMMSKRCVLLVELAANQRQGSTGSGIHIKPMFTFTCPPNIKSNCEIVLLFCDPYISGVVRFYLQRRAQAVQSGAEAAGFTLSLS